MLIVCWLVAACFEVAVYATSCSCSLTTLDSDESKPVGKVRTRNDDADRRLEVRALLQHLIMRPIRVELGRCMAEWILNASKRDTDRIIKIGLSALIYETSSCRVPRDWQPVGEQAVEDKSILARFTKVVARYATVPQLAVASAKDTLHMLRLLIYDDAGPYMTTPVLLIDLSAIGGFQTPDVFKALEHESHILEQLMLIESKSFWEVLVQGAMILVSVGGPQSLGSLAASLPDQVAVPILSGKPNVCLEMALDDYIAARERLTDPNREKAETFLAHWGSIKNQIGRFRGATELVFQRMQSLGTSRLRSPSSLLGAQSSGGLPTDGYLYSNVGHAEEEQLRTDVYEQAMCLEWGTKWYNQALVYIDDHGQGLFRFSDQEEAEFGEFVLDLTERRKRTGEPAFVDTSFPSRAKPVFAILMAVARSYGFQPTRKQNKCWWPFLSATLSRSVWRKIDKALRFPVDGFRASIQFLNLAHKSLAG